MRSLTSHIRPILIVLLATTVLSLWWRAGAVQNTQSPDRLWQVLDRNSVAIITSQLPLLRVEIPRQFQLIRFNKSRFQQILNQTVIAATAANVTPQTPVDRVITLPLPDGTFARFLV